MRFEQTLSLIILISYILYDLRSRSLFGLFDTRLLSQKIRLLTLSTCVLKFFSIFVITVTMACLVLLLFTDYMSDFYFLDLTTLPIFFSLFIISSLDLSLARGKEDVSYELLLKLSQSFVYSLIFLIIVIIYNITSLKDLISIQNSTFVFFPKWNVFLLAPLAYIFIDNSLLLLFNKKDGTAGELFFQQIYDFFLNLVIIVTFLILFMGGFFSFGNIDKLITHPRLLDLTQFLLAYIKLLIVVLFMKRAKAIFPILTRSEKLQKTFRNIVFCVLILLVVLIMKVLTWI